MSRTLKWGWPGLVLLGLLLVAVRGFDAQEPIGKPSGPYVDSLRDVINRGAKIFNDNGDHAGCYRMFEGALIAVKPYLEPGLQKEVDQALANAARLPSFVDKSFELRRVLDLIRDRGRPVVKDKVVDKVIDKDIVKDKKDKLDKALPKTDVVKDKIDKKDKTDKVEIKDKKIEPKTGDVKGKISYAGKPVGDGTITFVPDGGKGPGESVPVKGSAYAISGLMQGKYMIGIAAPGVPTKYKDAATSGLTFRVSPGPQVFDIALSDPMPIDPKDKKPTDKKEKAADKGVDKDKKLPKEKAEVKDKDEPEVIEKVGIRAEVVGKIMTDGAPLTGGFVVFTTQDGKNSYKGTIMNDSTYRVPALAVGDYKVSIIPAKKEEASVPMPFRNPVTSALTFRTVPGANNFDIILKK